MGVRRRKLRPAVGQGEFDWDHPIAPPVVIDVTVGSPPATSKLLRRAYRFRMYPTPTQERAMLNQAGACRFIWNWGLARKKEVYAATGKTLRAFDLNRELTALKRQEGMGWLYDVAVAPLQQSLRDLDQSFANFFGKRAQYPRFKARKRCQPSFRCHEHVRLVGDRVRIPKIGMVRIRGSRPIEGKTKSASFKRDASGRWHVAIDAEFTMPDVALPSPDPAKAVGIDFGLKDFAVLSNGEREPAPRFFRAAQRKLRRAQRQLSRRKPGSNRRAKAKIRVARIHARIADTRADFLHKFTTDIVGRFDVACIEDLNVAVLARTKRGFGKAFHDAAIGEACRQLAYKADWNRKRLAAVDRWYPSSRTCHACKAINAGLTLKDRDWACPGCGASVDRDHNASLNIRDEGMRMLAAGDAES